MITTWDSFPQGKQIKKHIVSQEKNQKTFHQQQLKITSAETKTNTKHDQQILRCHTSSMPSLAQLASNAIDPNFIEYIFPISEAGPVQGKGLFMKLIFRVNR